MRLLAIRGANLASLAGSFAVDFSRPPLADAGLFAITGPTGAGKSTLLDAVCLALYDTFPRLAQASKARVGPTGAGGGGDDIGGDDPRTILRRGAAEGHAEVDFVAADGRCYGARWEVRRARRNPGGRLQIQEMALRDLATGQALGGTRSETLAEIRRLVGLENDQFRRSVLLAQGEFDAFLRAEARDRSALLELMTGTRIYSEISRQAFARAKEAQRALAAIEREQALVPVLGDDERAALLASGTEHENAEAALAGERQQLQLERDWHAERQRRADALAQAEQELAAASGASAAAADDRARLGRLRQARPLLPLLDDVRRRDGEIEALAGAVERADAEAGAAGIALDQARAVHAEAAAALDQAETAFRDAGPLLSAAADLDTRVDEATRAVDATAADRATAATVLADLETRERTARQARQAVAAAIADLEAWLTGNEAVGRLADRLDDCLGQLDQWAAAGQRRDDLAERLVAALADLAGLRQRLDENERQQAAADAGIDRFREQGAGIETRLAATDAVALAAAAAAADAARTAATALRGVAGDAAALVARSRLHAARETAATLARIGADEALKALAPRRDVAAAALVEARQALPLATAALDEAAATLRGLLQPGEACPVCGATEHPAAAAATRFAERARAHVARVDALQARLDDLDRQIGHQRETLAAATRAWTDATAEAGPIAADADRCRAAWTASAADLVRYLQPLAIEPPPLPADPLEEPPPAATIAALAALLAAIDGEAGRARAALTRVRADEAARDRVRTDLDAARDARDRLVEALTAARRQAADTDRERIRLQEQRDAAAGETQTWATRLRPLLAVVGDWERQPVAAIAAACRRLAAGWNDKAASLRDQGEQAIALDRALSATQAAAKAARERQAEAGAKAQAAAEKLAELRRQRAALFEGRPTGAVRSALNQDRLDADKRAKAAADAVRLATGAAEAAAARAIDLGRRLADARAARAAKAAAAAHAANGCGVPLAEAETLLAIDPAWVAAAEARLAALATQMTEAAAVLGERQAAVAAHLAAGAPTVAAAAVAARLFDLDREIDAARRLLADIRAAVASDTGNRRRRDELGAAIDRQRATVERWKAISDLIGSQDGARFRRFAQRLTLERLLTLANLQLKDLSPRYRLQGVPGGELEIQVVDRDMADDVRSVASLSGGERFLASLALALGLAAMGSRQTPIETLFIDEGFGALDAESLEIAISALEALQATGRKVGVISHVQTMVERIGVQVQVQREGGGRSRVRVCRV